jgi:hypothetical protein
MLSLAIGLQWTALQSVAWVGMFLRFSSEGSLRQAVVKTFDGSHLCPICKLVRAGKTSEGKTATQAKVKQVDLLADRGPGFVFLALPSFSFSCVVLLPQRFDSPPLPPPRSCLG